MDESIIYLKEKFSLPQVDIQTYSPLTLAYIGDAAYELVVRTFLVDQGNSRPDKLHRKASSMVKAAAQAAMAANPSVEGEQDASISLRVTPQKAKQIHAQLISGVKYLVVPLENGESTQINGVDMDF